MIVISDTSPISNLYQIGRLDLLRQMFGKVLVPPAVDREVRKLSDFSIDISEYLGAEWIETSIPENTGRVAHFLKELDAGESEAIVLAQEKGADYLLIDERLGTKTAIAEGLQTVGLIGVLLKAKEVGLVEKIKPLLDELEEQAGFWISPKLKRHVLRDIGE